MGFRIKMPKKLYFGMSIIALMAMLISGNSFATQEFQDDLLETRDSIDYEQWLKLPDELKESVTMPNNSSSIVPTNKVNEYSQNKIPSIVDALMQTEYGGSLESIGASYSDSKYNLNSDAKIRVKHQGSTNECWAFSTISSFESNISLLDNNSMPEKYSERHMDYATSRTFLNNEVNPIGYSRELGEGGILKNGYYYLINGTGAVLEKDMPFEDNENKIALSEIDKPVDKIATGYAELPTIYKLYDDAGNPTYYNARGQELTNTELKAYRNLIKDHIVKYGALTAGQVANVDKYYSNQKDAALSKAYYCNSNAYGIDHAITIVGWDDNYSRNNFAEGNRPVHDGAYICLNTYGTYNFDNGYIYISYDDANIEVGLVGVKGTAKIDYDNLYQNDFYGGFAIIGTAKENMGYIASVYDAKSDNETLEYVGITVADYGNYTIYVNTSSGELNTGNIVNLGEYYLEPGYNRVKVNSTTIIGNKFAIIVKQAADSGTFYFPIESRIDSVGSPFLNVTATPGTSFVSFDGNYFLDLQEFNIQGFDMKTSDVCIKAFTSNEKTEPVTPIDDDPVIPIDDTPVNPIDDDPVIPIDDTPVNPIDDDPVIPIEDNPVKPIDDNPVQPIEDEKIEPIEDIIESDKPIDDEPKEEPKEFILIFEDYMIDNNYICNISADTSYGFFKTKMTTNQEYKLVRDDTEITDTTTIISTGDKLRVGDKTYWLSVKGDTSGDGKITLTDLSKLVLHFNGVKTKQLTDAFLKAGDINLDGKITLTDLSKLVVIFGRTE